MTQDNTKGPCLSEVVVERETGETLVRVNLALAGEGLRTISTGIGFLDHLLDAVAKRAGWGLRVAVQGDAHRTGAHHAAEDLGLALGEAIRTGVLGADPRVPAAAAPKGVLRYGQSLMPMDEALVLVAVDLSGRPLARMHGFEDLRVLAGGGDFTGDDWSAFCGGLALGGMLTLHQRVLDGVDPHHVLEASAKGLGMALGQACLPDASAQAVSTSTKGSVRLEVGK